MTRSGCFCGKVRIDVENKPEFMNFTYDAAEDTYTVSLNPTSEDYVGSYIPEFKAYL